nr:hypothetical protein [Tanacetum cinerariifolium]
MIHAHKLEQDELGGKYPEVVIIMKGRRQRNKRQQGKHRLHRHKLKQPQPQDKQRQHSSDEGDKRNKGKDVAMDDVVEEQGDHSMGENVRILMRRNGYSLDLPLI